MPKKSRLRKSQPKRSPETLAAQTVAISSATHKPWQIAVVCVVLAAVTIFAFRGVRSNEYIEMDDVGCVLVNPQVQQGFTMHSIEWAFTTYHCANWHPLTWITHIADWSFYGKSPGDHHMTNVYLHAASSVLLFLLLLYMTGFAGRSAMVAFLFALHPAHVESVAWLSERKDILCALFSRYDACLRLVCAQAILETVSMGGVRLCLRTYVEADGGYASTYFAVA